MKVEIKRTKKETVIIDDEVVKDVVRKYLECYVLQNYFIVKFRGEDWLGYRDLDNAECALRKATDIELAAFLVLASIKKE
jgi:Holliday junction resolvase